MSNPNPNNPQSALTGFTDKLIMQVVGQLLGATATGGLSVVAPVVMKLVTDNLPKLRARAAAFITEVAQVGGMPPEELEQKAKDALARSGDPNYVTDAYTKAGIPPVLGQRPPIAAPAETTKPPAVQPPVTQPPAPKPPEPKPEPPAPPVEPPAPAVKYLPTNHFPDPMKDDPSLLEEGYRRGDYVATFSGSGKFWGVVRGTDFAEDLPDGKIVYGGRWRVHHRIG